jgi:rubrerythrin
MNATPRAATLALRAPYICRGCGISITTPASFRVCPVCGIRIN